MHWLIIRALIGLALVGAALFESGPWTALGLFVVLVWLEIIEDRRRNNG